MSGAWRWAQLASESPEVSVAAVPDTTRRGFKPAHSLTSELEKPGSMNTEGDGLGRRSLQQAAAFRITWPRRSSMRSRLASVSARSIPCALPTQRAVAARRWHAPRSRPLTMSSRPAWPHRFVAVVQVEVLEQIAGFIKARRKRTLAPEEARRRGFKPTHRATSGR